MTSGKKLYGVLLTLVLLASPSLRAQTLPPEVARQGYADTILVNGKIVSMDDQAYNANPGRIYPAMAVKGTRIMALGANDYIRTLANQDTKVMDMGGRVVIPGIIDGHSHLFGSPALAQTMGIPYPGDGKAITVQAGRDMETTRLKVETAIKETVATMQPGQWLSVGITSNVQEGATTSKVFAWTVRGELENPQRLDRVAPVNPVVLQAFSRLTVNTAALDVLRKLFLHFDDYNANELSDLDDPASLGQVGLGPQAAIEWEIWYGKQPLSVLAEMVRRDWEMAAAHGQTAFGSRAYNQRIIDTVSYLNRQKVAPIRYMMLMETHRRPNHPEFGRQLYKMLGSLWGFGDDMMWIGGVSTELWDSSFPLHCFGKDIPAPPEIKIREMCREPGDLFWDAMKNALGAGWRTAGAHGVASDGLRRYTQMIESAMQEYNIPLEEMRKRRPTTDHAEAIGNLPDIMAKVKELGIIISVNPIRLHRTEDYKRDYGPVAESFMEPAKSWLDQGQTVVGQFEGYGGMGYQMNLLMTRNVNGHLVLPDEKLDRVPVLKMWTTWAPLYLMKEKDIGTLEVGKLADYVVLDKDYFTVPIEEIQKIRPQMTVVGGKVRSVQADFAGTLGMQPVGYQLPQGYYPWDRAAIDPIWGIGTQP